MQCTRVFGGAYTKVRCSNQAALGKVLCPHCTYQVCQLTSTCQTNSKLTAEQMGYLRRHLSPKLGEYFDEALQIKEHDVSEEIAICRTASIQAVQMYDAATNVFAMLCEDTTIDPALRKKAIDEAQAVLLQTISVVNANNEHITRLVERAAKIHSMIADKMHPDTIKHVIMQIQAILFDELGKNGDVEQIKRLNNRLSSELQLSNIGAPYHQVIQPTKEVELMDATVPSAPE